MTQQELSAQIESLVDKSSVDQVIRAVALVCFEKAEDIQINWQDRKLARVWERTGNSILGFRAKIPNNI